MSLSTQNIYLLFRQMFKVADQTLLDFTLQNNLKVEQKADKTFVTACDKILDQKLSQMATEAGFLVVSEEGEHSLEIVKSGYYITIDPIDGTLAYLKYLNSVLEQGNIQNFLQEDLGTQWDFCLLLGVVENGESRFGGVFNYVTKEIILLDSFEPQNLIREGKKRDLEATEIIFVDQRHAGRIEDELRAVSSNVETLASLGLRAVYASLNNYQNVCVYHGVQACGLWDILPAAVAAKTNGVEIYDNFGDSFKTNQYIMLPNKGVTILKGDKFRFVLENNK